MAVRLDKPPTNFMLHQIRLARIHANHHPLYRRWSMEAYEGRLAYWAEVIPEHLIQYLPVIFMASPFGALFLAVAFGKATVEAVFGLLALITLILIILIASLGPVLGAGIAALSLVVERQAGRWDLLMMIPRDRMSVLLIRISTIQFPFRPLIGTIDILQTLSAISLAFFLNIGRAEDTNILSSCFFFLLPSLLVLTWERRQDYALSLAIGAYAGLHYPEDKALGWALSSSGAMVALRGFLAIMALGLSPHPNGWGTVLPAFVAGPAVLPMLGVHLLRVALLWALYYGLREIVIIWLWRASEHRVEGWL